MFRYAILAILSAAALCTAAQAATPCATRGKAGCHRLHATAAVRGGSPAHKRVKSAVHRNSRQADRETRASAKSEALLARSLANRQSRLGEEHPSTLITANSLAAVYKAQGRFREAEALYHRTLEASEHAFGNGHPLTVATIRGLAALYRAQGRNAEAALLCRRTGLADSARYGY